MVDGTFVTAINCMDGRVQLPVIEYMKKRFGADYVDMITEPGPIKSLSENSDKATIESIRKRVKISITKHDSKVLAIVGHHDCAGNPVERDIQIKQLKESIKLARAWDFDVQYLTLFVNQLWEVEEI